MGPLYGKEEVKIWIAASMGGVPEIYTVLDWYTIDDGVVCFHMQNRRDNPDPEGPPYFDFPGLSTLWYAGDGRWLAEEDFWDLNGARRTAKLYAEACAKTGITEPEQRMTRSTGPRRRSGRVPTRPGTVVARRRRARSHPSERAGRAPRTAPRAEASLTP